VIRALEFYEQSKQRISEHNQKERAKEPAFDVCYFVLTDLRERIYERIEQRVDQMMEAGFLEEVKKLRAMGVQRDMTSMQGLGYRELYAHLEGEQTLEEAICKIKINTRHFAKRQLTWFRREKDVIWIDKNLYLDDSTILRDMRVNIEERARTEQSLGITR
jgi:tRNA dimethylallyltransferase